MILSCRPKKINKLKFTLLLTCFVVCLFCVFFFLTFPYLSFPSLTAIFYYNLRSYSIFPSLALLILLLLFVVATFGWFGKVFCMSHLPLWNSLLQMLQLHCPSGGDVNGGDKQYIWYLYHLEEKKRRKNKWN